MIERNSKNHLLGSLSKKERERCFKAFSESLVTAMKETGFTMQVTDLQGDEPAWLFSLFDDDGNRLNRITIRIDGVIEKIKATKARSGATR